jgi:hypothetical protein
MLVKLRTQPQRNGFRLGSGMPVPGESSEGDSGSPAEAAPGPGANPAAPPEDGRFSASGATSAPVVVPDAGAAPFCGAFGAVASVPLAAV